MAWQTHLSQYTYSREVAANPALVWAVVNDHARGATWLPLGGLASPPGDVSRPPRVGALRVLTIGGLTLVERMVEHVPESTVTFKLVSGLGGHRYVYTVDVRPSSSGCRLTTSVVVDVPVPLAALLVPVALRALTCIVTWEIARLARAMAHQGRIGAHFVDSMPPSSSSAEGRPTAPRVTRDVVGVNGGASRPYSTPDFR